MSQIGEVPDKKMSKEPYNPPRFVSYGDLLHTTRTVAGGMGHKDHGGGGGGNIKT
jgi:hypothetical protein